MAIMEEAYNLRARDFAPFFIGLVPYVNRVSKYIKEGGRLPDDSWTNAKIFSYMMYQSGTVSAGTFGAAFSIIPAAEGLEELIAMLF